MALARLPGKEGIAEFRRKSSFLLRIYAASPEPLPAIIVTEDDLETFAWRGGEDHRQPLLVFLKELEQRAAALVAG